MPKDYARYPFKPRGRWLEQGWAKRLFIVVAGALLAGTLAGGVYVWKTMAWNNAKVRGIIVQIKRLAHHQNKGGAAQLAQSTTDTVDDGPQVHFDFYTELPQMKVKVADKNLAVATVPANYFLEIGTFADESTAGERRLSLLLAGAEAEVVKLTANGKMAFYLQQGPFLNLTEAQRAQQGLQKKGIESVIKKRSF